MNSGMNSGGHGSMENDGKEYMERLNGDIEMSEFDDEKELSRKVCIVVPYDSSLRAQCLLTYYTHVCEVW